MRQRFRDWVRRLIGRMRRVTVIAFIIGVADRLGTADSGDMAASLSYYAFLSVFPLLAGAIAVLGFFLPSATVQSQVLQFFERYLPGSSQLIERNIEGIVGARGILGILGILGFFWTGSVVFGALERVVNRTWHTPVRRPFYLRKLRDVGLATTVGLTFYLSMGLSAFSAIVPVVNAAVLASVTEAAGRALSFVLILGTFLLVYKHMPNTDTRWRDVWPAAVVAALIFELARTAFALYLARFARYEIVYGSLGAIAAMLVWLYVSAYTVVIGAGLASEFSRARRGQ